MILKVGAKLLQILGIKDFLCAVATPGWAVSSMKGITEAEVGTFLWSFIVRLFYCTPFVPLLSSKSSSSALFILVLEQRTIRTLH